jgi:arylsulfatase A-like enzyme
VSRRALLPQVAIVLGLLTACSPTPPATPAAPTVSADTPVIIYLIDTLRADRLGLYGYGKPTSPRIDALAKESVVFDAAYAAAPWTLPSVASLMTSTYSCEHGLLRHNLRLSPKLITLAERLQALGYATAGYYQNTLIGPITALDRGLQISELHAEATRSFLPEARAFLDQIGGKPFFLYLHTMEPHNIEQVPPQYLKTLGHVSVDDREVYTAHWDGMNMSLRVDRQVGQPLGTVDNEADVRHAMASLAALGDAITRLYDAAVLQADTNLGEVVDLLKERGLWDRALFIVLADHGESFGDHGTWFHEHTVYEELIRVPLLVHFPKGAFGGKRINERVSLLDVMPTILDYLGDRDRCTGCRGQSMMPLIRGSEAAWRPAEVTALRINRNSYFRPHKELRGDLNVAVRDGSLKGIWNDEVSRLELYDLATDPGELRDLATDSAKAGRDLAQRADQWLNECQATLIAPTEIAISDIDEKTRERLRALGYIR